MTDLTDREWKVMEAIQNQVPIPTLAATWGTTTQNVYNVVQSLRGKGVICPLDGVGGVGGQPFRFAYQEKYPWTVPDGQDLRYRPALPPKATLRAKYATDSNKDLSVPPVRFVRWDGGGWTVQGLPTCRPDGVDPWRMVPKHRVVWAVHDAGGEAAFSARVDEFWCESWTVREFEFGPDELPDELPTYLTLMIAAAVGVEALLDVSGVGR